MIAEEHQLKQSLRSFEQSLLVALPSDSLKVCLSFWTKHPLRRPYKTTLKADVWVSLGREMCFPLVAARTFLANE